MARAVIPVAYRLAEGRTRSPVFLREICRTRPRGLCSAARLNGLGQFNNVPERIGEESDLAVDLVDLKRFSENPYVAASQLVQSGLDVCDS